MTDHHWHAGTVQHGQKRGQTIGFPTINLDPNILPSDTRTGVYAARVIITNTDYIGALYFGPRLVVSEKKPVLEIHILDTANGMEPLYEYKVQFSLVRWIRAPMNFTSLELMKEQITHDIAQIRVACQKYTN